MNSMVSWLRVSISKTSLMNKHVFTGRAEVLFMASDHSPLTRPVADGLVVPERKEDQTLWTAVSSIGTPPLIQKL